MNEGLLALMKEHLSYSPDTGNFMWVKNTHRKNKVGKVAGCKLNAGYVQITFHGKRYLAHRLAIAFIEGAFPELDVDHKNGVRDDNRLANLRHANSSENGQNMKRSTRNTSGFMGVNWNKQAGKWFARICSGGHREFLGMFDEPNVAYEAYLRAKKEVHQFQPVPRHHLSEKLNNKEIA